MDISTATAQKRREFSQITTVLRNHNVHYKWGFPANRIVTFQNQAKTFFTPKEGIKWLLNWGLLNFPPSDSQMRWPPACPPDPLHLATLHTCQLQDESCYFQHNEIALFSHFAFSMNVLGECDTNCASLFPPGK